MILGVYIPIHMPVKNSCATAEAVMFITTEALLKKIVAAVSSTKKAEKSCEE